MIKAGYKIEMNRVRPFVAAKLWQKVFFAGFDSDSGTAIGFLIADVVEAAEKRMTGVSICGILKKSIWSHSSVCL